MGYRTHAAQLLFVFVASTFAFSAHAAVYRCGAVYQDTPCAGGSTIQAEDPSTPQQRAEATRAVQNDAARAEALKMQRKKQEALQAKQQQTTQKIHLAQEAEAAKEAKAKAALAAKAEAQHQKTLKPRKITTPKTPLPKASAAKVP